jgi:hypothetical protein
MKQFKFKVSTQSEGNTENAKTIETRGMSLGQRPLFRPAHGG